MEVGDAATNQRGRAGFHEPGHSSSSSFSSSPSTTHPVWTFSRTRRTTRTRTNQFRVPMHERKRKEALPEMQRRASIPPAAVGKAEGSPQPARAGALAGQAGRLPYVGRAPVHGPIAHPEFEVGPAREPPESPPGFGLRQSS